MIELTTMQLVFVIIMIWASGIAIGTVIAVNLYIKSVEKQILKKADKLTKRLNT